MDEILRFLGGVIAYGGGGAVVAYFIFKFLAKSWIESKFAQRLEQHKHQQALELQRLRVEIDSMLSGAIKIQEKEFETLPEAWSKLDEAYGQIRQLLSPLQQYADLDRFNKEQLDEFLEGAKLYESQKQEIRDATNKVKLYSEIIFLHRLFDVKKAFADFHNYIARHGIFFPPSLKENLTKISDHLWDALVEKEVGSQAGDYKMQTDAWRNLKKETEPLYKAIELEIQTRLHAHGGKR